MCVSPMYDERLEAEPDPLYALTVQSGLDLDNPLAIREFIVLAEKKMAEHPDAVFGDNEGCPLKHHYAPGVVCREIFIPAGVLIVGKIHKHEHPNILSKGKVSVLTEGGGVEILEGPLHMVSKPGTKRLLFTHEDTIWTTIHACDAKNPEELEEFAIAKSYDEYEKFIAEGEETKCLSQQ